MAFIRFAFLFFAVGAAGAAKLRDGGSFTRTVSVEKQSAECVLPFTIRWSDVKDPQDAGQYVDGRWVLAPQGLRTGQVGYDRIFLVGNRTWRDYEVRTTVTYAVRFACRTLPDDAAGHGVTEYSYKLWRAGTPEPSGWSWQQTQVSRDGLRTGGVALLPHFADVTFGDVRVVPVP
jgi:hypothetical protein